MDSHDEPILSSEPDDREATTRERIRSLLDRQPFAVLCTQGEGQPYGSVVAYAVGPDLRSVAFATPRETHKYRLLCGCKAVALAIDSRSQFPEDMNKVEAITASGIATELELGPERDRWADLLAQRHPRLESFVHAPSSALFRIDVVHYVHVSRFQEVRQWIPKQ